MFPESESAYCRLRAWTQLEGNPPLVNIWWQRDRNQRNSSTHHTSYKNKTTTNTNVNNNITIISTYDGRKTATNASLALAIPQQKNKTNNIVNTNINNSFKAISTPTIVKVNSSSRFTPKHRKNCECCPGHSLIVNH